MLRSSLENVGNKGRIRGSPLSGLSALPDHFNNLLGLGLSFEAVFPAGKSTWQAFDSRIGTTHRLCPPHLPYELGFSHAQRPLGPANSNAKLST